METRIKVGILSGTGVDAERLISVKGSETVNTPYGAPSGPVLSGVIGNTPCVIISRHGKDHKSHAGRVNYRANIWALKKQGCTHVIATTACGSLREEICPQDMVFIDQFIDRTTSRVQTFYNGSDGACHVSTAEPFCKESRQLLCAAAMELGIRFHSTGTMVTIEGPRFSTRAESRMYRMWGADVINMTTVPEAVLAKEAGLCYAAVALVTDYDCWKERDAPVTVDMVMAAMKNNGDSATRLIKMWVEMAEKENWSEVIFQAQEQARNAVVRTG
ncbi:putative purine nucleoside phosphorylase [Namao virus]|nr:putative purine nucleoside phosphorylase [Namao virus]